jgi:hypothetical protein
MQYGYDRPAQRGISQKMRLPALPAGKLENLSFEKLFVNAVAGLATGTTEDHLYVL